MRSVQSGRFVFVVKNGVANVAPLRWRVVDGQAVIEQAYGGEQVVTEVVYRHRRVAVSVREPKKAGS
jgi:hypothetical protein